MTPPPQVLPAMRIRTSWMSMKRLCKGYAASRNFSARKMPLINPYWGNLTLRQPKRRREGGYRPLPRRHQGQPRSTVDKLGDWRVECQPKVWLTLLDHPEVYHESSQAVPPSHFYAPLPRAQEPTKKIKHLGWMETVMTGRGGVEGRQGKT